MTATNTVATTLRQLSGLGWSAETLEAAADVVLVDLAEAGYGVVKLPESDVIAVDEYQYWDDKDVTARAGEGVVYVGAEEFTTAEILDFAGVLAAAAALAGPNRTVTQ